MTIGGEAGGLSLNYNYYGLANTACVNSYNWQVSADGETGWTDISGANTQIYEPAAGVKGKYIRAAVSVVAGAVSIDSEYSEPYYVFNGVYTSISLGKSRCNFIKGTDAEYKLNVTGFDEIGTERYLTSYANIDFSSSDTGVVSVDSEGVLTINNYGIAVVTATSGNLSASLLVTVTASDAINNAETSTGSSCHSTDLVRTGSYSYKIQGETLEKGTEDYAYDYAKINPIISQWNTVPANAVMSVWFYDNGANEDSEVGVYWSAYQRDSLGTKAVGIINSSDTTYKLTGKGARRSLSALNNWREGSHVGICSEVTNTLIDTGIARTKGWHQVTFVRKNTNASAKIEDHRGSGEVFPKSTSCDIYIDGILVDSEVSDRSFVVLYGYAGYNGDHSAYLADATIIQYIGAEDILLSENNATLNSSYSYYGRAGGNATAEIKWYYSDDAASGIWTEISGATAAQYTPDSSVAGKYVRAGVKFTEALDGNSTKEYFTNVYFVETQTTLSYNNGKVYITSSSNIEDAVLVIVELKTVGSFTKLISSRMINIDSVTANVQKSVSTGTISPASGSKVKIMLWDDINSQRSLCGATTIE